MLLYIIYDSVFYIVIIIIAGIWMGSWARLEITNNNNTSGVYFRPSIPEEHRIFSWGHSKYN